MATKKLRSIKGRIVRLTRMDQCGLPVFGSAASIVSKGFVQVTIGREEEAGEEYTQKNAWGELWVSEKDPDIMKWAPVGIQFAEMDPDALDIIANATPLIVGSDTIGAAFGSAAPTGAFALEVWTKAAGQNACAGGLPQWGYFAVPFISNGKIDGEITIANSVLTVSMTGEGHDDEGSWGTGPYGDNPLLVLAGFPSGHAWAQVITTVQPPEPTVGVVALSNIAEIESGDTFPVNQFVTAQTDAEGLTLEGLGYTPATNTNWSTGEFFTIGTFQFNWNGTVWKAGAHT